VCFYAWAHQELGVHVAGEELISFRRAAGCFSPKQKQLRHSVLLMHE
jgi:hypothetical protein